MHLNRLTRPLGALAAMALAAPAASLAAAPRAGSASAVATAQIQSLQAVLGRDLRRAGPSAGAYVADLSSNRTLFSARSDTARSPASVEKLYTTSTALLRFGATATLTTAVLGVGSLDHRGAWHGTFYLRGGGDPTLGDANFVHHYYGTGTTISALARKLIDGTGITAVDGPILGDESLFDSLRGGPSTGFALDTNIGDLSALAFDRGASDAGRRPDPAAFAARKLAAALRVDGVPIHGASGAGAASPGAPVLASIASPPIATLVKLTLVPSDNFFAETLLKDVGAHFGAGGTTPAGAGVVRAEMARIGIHPRVYDGSGLSRADHTSPHQLVTLLSRIRTTPAGASLTKALPVAGHTGTLADRMRGTAADGRCDAKTGTLSDVSALAGYCHARGGHLLAFGFLMHSTDVTNARAVQDAMAIALARFNDRTPIPPAAQPPTTTPR